MVKTLPDADEAHLVATMAVALRAERSAAAVTLLAAGHLYRRRTAGVADDERAQWAIDHWEMVAAEVGAALGVGRRRASIYLQYGVTLVERLPSFGAVCAAGDVDMRIVAAVDHRTALVDDPAVLRRLDDELARVAPGWNRRSRGKVDEWIDWLVLRLDPMAVRRARSATDDRSLTVTPAGDGMAEVWGRLRALDAAVLDRRLSDLAGTVCADDPRTTAQRRADALAALAAGNETLACECTRTSCPADGNDATPGTVVVHVLAGPDGTTPVSETLPAVMPGWGAVTPEALHDAATRGRTRAMSPEQAPRLCDRYRPTRTLADFVRARDLTCRFPGCDVSAHDADIDHTVPFPEGATHPSNLKALCRAHHLLKTHCSGVGGWRDEQLPDGTVVWTGPSGHTWTTAPSGAMFDPRLAAPTGEAPRSGRRARSGGCTGAAMPTRRRARSVERAERYARERRANEADAAANPPPF